MKRILMNSKYNHKVKTVERQLEDKNHQSYETTVELISEALNIKETGYAYFLRGIAKLKLSKNGGNSHYSREFLNKIFEDSLLDLLTASEKEPNDLNLLKNIADELFVNSAYEKSSIVFEKCLLNKPGDLSLKESLGECYFKLGSFDEALRMFTAVDSSTDSMKTDSLMKNLWRRFFVKKSSTRYIYKDDLWDIMGDCYRSKNMLDAAIQKYLNLVYYGSTEKGFLAIEKIVKCYEESKDKQISYSKIIEFYSYIEKNKELKRRSKYYIDSSTYDRLDKVINK